VIKGVPDIGQRILEHLPEIHVITWLKNTWCASIWTSATWDWLCPPWSKHRLLCRPDIHHCKRFSIMRCNTEFSSGVYCLICYLLSSSVHIHSLTLHFTDKKNITTMNMSPSLRVWNHIYVLHPFYQAWKSLIVKKIVIKSLCDNDLHRGEQILVFLWRLSKVGQFEDWASKWTWSYALFFILLILKNVGKKMVLLPMFHTSHAEWNMWNPKKINQFVAETPFGLGPEITCHAQICVWTMPGVQGRDSIGIPFGTQ
jgi:hypothetical protein